MGLFKKKKSLKDYPTPNIKSLFENSLRMSDSKTCKFKRLDVPDIKDFNVDVKE